MASSIEGGRRRKAEVQVLVNKSGSDAAKVDAVGATCEVYLAGATVRTATGTINGAGQTIAISDPGMIEVGDVLQNGTSASPTFTVTAIDRALSGTTFTWSLTVTVSSSTSVSQDSRLINTSRRPTAYKDPNGLVSWGGSSVTTTSSGLARFYCKARMVDLIVSGGSPSVTATVIRDIETSEAGWELNVLDHGGSIKSTLAYLEDLRNGSGEGAIIRVPAGRYNYDAAEMEIEIPSNVTIRGDGKFTTRITAEATSGNEDLAMFIVRGSRVTIEGMTLVGRAHEDLAGQGVGIMVGWDDSTTTLNQVVIRQMDIFNFDKHQVECGRRSDNSLWGVDFFHMDNCRLGGATASTSGAAQLRIGSGSTMGIVSTCGIGDGGSGGYSSGSGVLGIHMAGTGNWTFMNCDGEPPDADTIYFKVEPYNSFAEPEDGGANLLILNCDWETDDTVTTEVVPMVYIQGHSGVHIKNCLFFKMGSGVHLEDCYAPRVEGCIFKALGGSGFALKFTDCFSPQSHGNMVEAADGETADGRRSQITVTYAGNNPGRSRWDAGFVVPTFADDNERDTAPGTGIDDKRALTDAGTLIYVVTPTTPSSHLQIRHGGAWVGIGDQSGTAPI